MEKRSKDQSKYRREILILALIIVLLASVVGTALTAQIFIKPGPQGEQGLPGIAGVNGTDSILQILQNRNVTQVDVSSYNATQWYNISDFDSAMEITINVQQNSKVFAQFSAFHILAPPASIWIRIVVDNSYNSSMCMLSVGPPANGTYKMPRHIEFLTDPLNAGSHTIKVQFMREGAGSTELLDRTLTVMEITAQ